MRLPRLSDGNADIDHIQFRRMLDTYLERGFTYFDTAYMYHDGESECAVRDDLVARHPRDSFTLTDKLPTMRLQIKEDMPRIFDEQRRKCGVEYFDYYLLHNLNVKHYDTAERLGAFEFIRKKKQAEEVRQTGFSFHADAGLLDRILTEHPEIDVVQLQINYLDWESPRVQSRECFETARRHGKPVIVMEPVKGGALAALPDNAAALLRAVDPDASPASWAIRFAAGLDGVLTVLSGMSDYAQLLDNTGYMSDFKPLDENCQAVIRQVRRILYHTNTIPCTACSYCTGGCPASIPIPDIFRLRNVSFKKDSDADALLAEYRALSGGRVSDCIGCGQCEAQCPQDLPVIELLKTVAKHFGE